MKGQLTQKQKIGAMGENIAVKHLVKRDFSVVERNYRKKWGEIDIIAKKGNVLHFIEVKTVCSARFSRDTWLPEENVHYWKRKRLSRAIQTYLMEQKVSHDTLWQIDVIAVLLDLERKKAKIRITEDIRL